jgi:hypothetical protein
MEILEDNFYEIYKPCENHLDKHSSFGGLMYETYGEELLYIKELSKNSKRVWSIVEVEDDNLELTFEAGFRDDSMVLGYIVTEEPWISGEEVVILDFNFD